MEGIKRLWRSIPRAGKASFALFLANTVTAGIAYITTPLYTRLLTADEYGQVSVFLSWKQIFGIVAMFSLAGGVFNNGMVDYPKKRDEFSLSMLGLSNAITLIVCSALLVCYQFVKHWIGLDAILILLMTGTFILRPAYEFWCSRQRYELKYKAMTVWIIACAFFSPAIAVICIYLFNNDRVYARIFGGEIPLIIIYAGFYIHLIIKGSGRIDTKYWKSAFLFNLPLLPHYLSANILNSSDRVMISQLISDAATAHYTVAYSVAAVITIVWSAANGSLLPYTYEKCKEKKYQDISRVTQALLTLFAACCVCVIMSAPEVISIMATDEYKDAIYVVPPVVAGVFFQVHYSIYGNIVYYFKRPKYVMYASVSAAVSNIVLNRIFIPIYGFTAAGYTTMISYFVQAVIDYFAMKNVVGIAIYNMKYIGLLSIVVIGVSLFSVVLYHNTLVRYGLIALVVAVVFYFRRALIKMIKLYLDKAVD